MQRRNNNKGFPPTSRRNRGTKQKFVTTRSLNGGKIITTLDPPVVTYQPWNHITLAWITAPKDINFGDLVNQIKVQIDPNNNGFLQQGLCLQMHVHSVRVWNLTGKTVALTVYDFHDSDDSDQLCGLMDAGSKVGIPRLGYELPLAHRNSVQRNDSKTGARKLYTTSAASSDSILQYVRMEWRFDGPVKGPTLDLDYAKQTFEVLKDTQVQVAHMRADTKKLVDLQPSTVERIINGITHHAAEVAMLGYEMDTLKDLTDALKELQTNEFVVLKNN